MNDKIISTDTSITNAPQKNYCAPMHTAEHILNQTMIRMFNCGRAFSAHIEAKKSKCDYKINSALLPEQLAEIERRVNEVINKNLEVCAKYVSREDAAKVCDLSKLPEDASETVRLVYVGDYDVCPCIGNHVANTSEIGTFKIISADFDNDKLRLRWKIVSR